MEKSAVQVLGVAYHGIVEKVFAVSHSGGNFTDLPNIWALLWICLQHVTLVTKK